LVERIYLRQRSSAVEPVASGDRMGLLSRVRVFWLY